MSDTIRGKVTNVVDGDTFEMSVTHIGKNNEYEYSNTETIRVAEIDEPELSTKAGKKSKEILENELNGKEVRVTVSARDTFGRVVGAYKLV